MQLEANALESKRARQRRALSAVLAFTVLGGLGGAVFMYFDNQVLHESTIDGVVTQVWRERGDIARCLMRLYDGVVLNEQCYGFEAGAQVTLDKSRRRLTGRAVYSSPRRK